MEDTNRVIIDGANPSIIWTQYMDFLSTYGAQMKRAYAKRMRENNPFTWSELDVMNKELHDKLDYLMTWKDDMKTENRNKNVVRLTESKLKQIVAESVKKVLKEWDSDDDFVGHGYKTTSNLGGNEIQISDSGDAARLKFPNGRITDWLEIEFDEEGVAYITTPDGDMERLDEYMRFR